MDFTVWVLAGAGAAVLIVLAGFYAPARTKIIIDTPTSTARAEMRVLWGLGPMFISRALPRVSTETPLAVFNDAVRIGHALMTPGIAEAAYGAVRQLLELRPSIARVGLGVNLGDHAQNLVVQTAVQAATAAAPASVRERFVIGKCEAPGAELNAVFEVNASPAKLAAIYGGLRRSRAVKEFGRRLTRKIKAPKKPTREVRVS